MRTTRRFSKEFKEAIVKKVLLRGNQTIEDFCSKNNLAISSVARWQSQYANVPEMNHKKNKSKYSAEEILKIVSETFSLKEDELGLYLRKNGRKRSNKPGCQAGGLMPIMTSASRS